MATPNIVPRADSEGGLGTASKYWASAYIDLIYVGAGKIGRDADNLLDFSTDNQIQWRVGAANKLKLNNATLFPAANDGLALGGGGNGWSDLYLASGAVINFDNGNLTLTHSSNALTLADNDELQFGTGSDLQIYHTSSSNSYIKNNTGNLYIKTDVNDGDIIFQCDDGSGGVTAYLTLDGGNSRVEFSKNLKLSDSVYLLIGTGNDLQLLHNGSHSFIINDTGDLTFRQLVDDGDIIFESDDGSGGTTAYLTLDGGDGIINIAKNTRFLDNVIAKFGSSGDLQIKHNATASSIENYTGDLTILNTTQDNDIIFRGDNGEANTTVATYFYLDGSSATHDGSATTALYTNWPDKSRISLGTGHDLLLYHSGTYSNIDNNTGNLYITNHQNDGDIIFKCDDGSGGATAYLTLDGSAANMKATTDMIFSDNKAVMFGDSGDAFFKHDGSNFSFINDVGNVTFTNRTDDGDIIFQSDDGSGGVETYFYLDGSANGALPATVFPDDSNLILGTGYDLRIYHNATDSYLDNYGGDLILQQHTDDGDIIFKSDDGSGGTTAYLTLDGSAQTTNVSKDLRADDNINLSCGTSGDLNFRHDGTDSHIDNWTNDLTITNYSDDKDIIFKCDDGSGGVETYFFLDGSAGSGSPITNFPDGSYLTFGASQDLQIYHDGTASTYFKTTAGDLYIRNEADDQQIYIQCDDGSGGLANYLTIDGANGITTIGKTLQFSDNIHADFGNSHDLQIYHDGTDSHIRNTQDVGDLVIRNSGDDKDIIFQADDGNGSDATYFSLDGSQATHDGSATTALITQWPDNSKIYVGTGGDGRFFHDGSHTYLQNTTGDLILQNFHDDGDIIFKSDDGSGGTTEYFRLDGGDTEVIFSKNIVCLDNVKAKFGGGNDLEIYHDGSNSYIKDSGDGNLYIDAATSIYVRNNANGEVWIQGTDAGVSLRYQDSQRLITTATGIAVTGATGTTEGGGIDASDAVNITVGTINGEIITTINVDIGVGGILSSGSAGDVIGNDGVASAYITRLTTAINGIVYKGEMICVEVPTTGDPDINLTASSESGIAEDQAGEGQHVLINGGVATLAAKNDITIPSGGIVGDYLYLTHGGTTAGTYNAGQFIIKLYGAATL